ncbi:GNAT family N-acetyltransferase [Nonomuraea sp. NPDC050680]|uniref:GNAT family N-acetyltransferase n=1 Tax=Nonomuraea sp. NPDC050680 TaxID=3154630 RepID=UPI0033D2B1DD
MPEILRLSDGTVTLSPLGLNDVDAHLAGEDDQLVRWLNGGPGTRAAVEAHVRRTLEHWATGGPVHTFGVRTEGILAGTIDVQFDQPYLVPGQVNLAYGLYPAWRGRGLATRAVRLACLHAAAVGANQAIIRVDPDNTPSAAVARRSGFTYVKRSRDEDGDRLDWYVRHLTASIRQRPQS